jgi:hypothetical protein
MYKTPVLNMTLFELFIYWITTMKLQLGIPELDEETKFSVSKFWYLFI